MKFTLKILLLLKDKMGLRTKNFLNIFEGHFFYLGGGVFPGAHMGWWYGGIAWWGVGPSVVCGFGGGSAGGAVFLGGLDPPVQTMGAGHWAIIL